jgi:hypothetical protein
MVTQGRNGDACLFSGMQNRGPLWDFNLLVVDGYRNHRYSFFGTRNRQKSRSARKREARKMRTAC